MEVKINDIIEQDFQVETIDAEYKKYAYCPENNGNTLQTFTEERVSVMVTFDDEANDITFTVACDGHSDEGEWFGFNYYINDEEDDALREEIADRFGLEYDDPKVVEYVGKYKDAVEEQVIEKTKNEFLSRQIDNEEELNIPVELKEAKIIDDKLITSFQSKNGKDSVLIVIDKENNVDVVNSATLKKIASDNHTSKETLLERMTDISKANHYANKDEILESSKKALNKNEVDNTLDQDVKAKRKFKR